MANVTDLDLLKSMTYMVLDNGDADATGTTLLTTMFSIPQMISALNQRQWRFLKDTGCVTTRDSIAMLAGQQRYDTTDTYIDTRRLAASPSGSSSRALFRTDAWALDQGYSTWQQDAGTPETWQQSTLPTRALEIAPIPSTNGTLSHLYIALSTTLTGLGVEMTVPDEFSWAVMYGALADLLSSDGESFDPKRAEYCESRYAMGVELCRMLIKGGSQ